VTKGESLLLRLLAAWQAVEKHPSVSLRSSFVIATYGSAYDSFLKITRALHLDVFDQPA